MVQNARIYTLPERLPPIYLSGFGPKAAVLAGRIGDGICTTPNQELISTFREAGGAGKPMQAGTKVCWAPTVEQGAKTAHRLCANAGLPGELSQILPTPRHFEQAMGLVTEEMTEFVGALRSGPGPAPGGDQRVRRGRVRRGLRQSDGAATGRVLRLLGRRARPPVTRRLAPGSQHRAVQPGDQIGQRLLDLHRTRRPPLGIAESTGAHADTGDAQPGGGAEVPGGVADRDRRTTSDLVHCHGQQIRCRLGLLDVIGGGSGLGQVACVEQIPNARCQAMARW